MEVTRISDLPNNNGVGVGYSSGGGGGGNEFSSRDAGSRGIGMGQQYQPLNIHQNPYGIPEPTDTQYEDRMVKMTDEHQKEKHRKDLIGSLYDEFQTPILIGVLFFLFQIPIINTLMFKYLSFMKIYNDDGNLNLYGFMFKSVLFGLTYFGFVRLTTFV